MAGPPNDSAGGISRRTLLALATGSVSATTGGCVQQAGSLLNRRTKKPISLSIKTVPADRDQAATRIARAVATNLDAVGINTEVVLMAQDELLRDILVNHEFDLYVARYPEFWDPDFLRPLLHSVYSDEPGWQNPFGMTTITVDSLLEKQRGLGGDPRRNVVNELQREIALQQPFTVVCVPDNVSAVRTDRFTGWNTFGLRSPLGYLAIRPTTGSQPSMNRSNTVAEHDQLRVTTNDARVTENFNPIAVEFRGHGTFTGLLYDSLVRWSAGDVHPWLAESWKWGASENRTTATVKLRKDLRWHDGRSLSTDDVAFTYRFLADTSLGSDETPVPAPRYRGRVSLVESVVPLDDRTLQMQFPETSPEVALRAMAVPILPRHEWEPQATEADLAGINVVEGVTEALVWSNPEPVGSGMFAFKRSVPEEVLILERFEDHFLSTDPPEKINEAFPNGISFEELVVRVIPSDTAAVELIAANEADATASSVDPSVVPRIGRSDEMDLIVDTSRTFYHLGFNARRDPLSNPRFRRAVAGLVDKRGITDDVFDGYALPAASPLAGTEWIPSDLRWNSVDPAVPFIGTDNELDTDTARDVFREAGYRYDDDRLVQ